MWMREKISTRETVREEGTSSMGVHTRVSLISHTDRTLTWIMIQEITIGAIKKKEAPSEASLVNPPKLGLSMSCGQKYKFFPMKKNVILP